MDALHILNPPPKYERKIESSEESDSSIKEMKRESKRVKRSEIIEHIRQYKNIQNEDVYHSDGSEKKQGVSIE